MFDRVIVLVAVNADKRPTAEAAVRATQVRNAMPAGWDNVEVDTWAGPTTAYCVRRGAAVIVRGVRTAATFYTDTHRDGTAGHGRLASAGPGGEPGGYGTTVNTTWASRPPTRTYFTHEPTCALVHGPPGPVHRPVPSVRTPG
jgi:hypothetical protein